MKHIICPLCNQKTDFHHVLVAHDDFWDNKYPTEKIPDNIEEFNKRFDMIGLHIEVVED
jgi:hypothetical protein